MDKTWVILSVSTKLSLNTEGLRSSVTNPSQPSILRHVEVFEVRGGGSWGM